MTLSLERMTDTLPIGFTELDADAKADGHGHLTRLAAEFAQSPAIFHAIFACHLDGELAGIGAITDEPALTSQPTWRMRRLYVHRRFRRRNVARAIANALLQEAAENVSTVTVHAGNDGAARFWEAIGFLPVAGCTWSHETTIVAPRRCAAGFQLECKAGHCDGLPLKVTATPPRPSRPDRSFSRF
jgi:GNAT superfamily N-acetyltransferase